MTISIMEVRGRDEGITVVKISTEYIEKNEESISLHDILHPIIP